MSIGDVKEFTCKTCGSDFKFTVKGAGRHPQNCKEHRDPEVRRRETYDPWLWENTVLEWNE